MRELILALLQASVISVEPMVLMELRLRSSSESSWLELWSLDEAVDSCPLESMLVAPVEVGVASGMTSVATSGLTSVAIWLGRCSLSGISTTDSKSLSGVSVNAANGLGVPINDAVGVMIFGVSFITPMVTRAGLLYISSNYAKE